MSCKDSKKQAGSGILTTENRTKTVVLKYLWKTDSTLAIPEAVCFNPNNKTIYVSNIGKIPPNAKDGDGTLSCIDTDGKVIKLNWVTGLNAPKGQAIYKGKLFVADIDEVIKIDIETATIEKRYHIEGAKFLNDIAIDAQGTIYITDTYDNKIHKISNNQVSTWKSFTDFNPNGILVENNSIIAVSYSKGHLIAINKETIAETLIAKGIRGGDGIVAIAEGYIVSSWAGEVYFAAKDLKGAAATKILDTKKAKINAADIAIISKRNILLIPTFFANTVDAYKISVE